MLTKVTAYSQWANVEPLVLNVINRPESDLFEVRNFDGLGPVKADVNTQPRGAVPGESFVGTNIGSRNLVLTLGLTPDWDTWTVAKLRQYLAAFFMPQQTIRFVFESYEFSPVEISGHIESNEPNMFSKDPEQQISIICPELYFRSVDPTIIEGTTDQNPISIDYGGSVETGIVVSVGSSLTAGDPEPDWIKIAVNDPLENSLQIAVPNHVEPLPPALSEYVYTMSSVPGEKYVNEIAPDDSIESLLNAITVIDNNPRNRRWPKIGPGTSDFSVTSQVAVQEWTLSYYELYGSL